MTDKAPVTVEQGDREAAADIHKALFFGTETALCELIRAGARDAEASVKIVAAHRQQSVASLEEQNRSMERVCREIAERALALEEESRRLRTGWWNDMRKRGVTQDNAIEAIRTALEGRGS